MSNKGFFSHKLIYIAMGTSLYASALCSYAESPSIKAGKYIAEGGWGDLTITKSKQQLHFSILSMGANAHVCDLDGEIKNNRASLETDDQPCIIDFTPQGSHIQVDGDENCRYYCGARAFFSGLYLKPESGCSDKERASTRKKFKKLYDGEEYESAVTTLEPLLSQCEKTLDWIEDGRIRNDLAVAYYHLEKFAECQETLEPLQNSVGQTGEKLPQTEQELKELLPPSDFEMFLPVAKATWHNTRLCSAE